MVRPTISVTGESGRRRTTVSSRKETAPAAENERPAPAMPSESEAHPAEEPSILEYDSLHDEAEAVAEAPLNGGRSTGRWRRRVAGRWRWTPGRRHSGCWSPA